MSAMFLVSGIVVIRATRDTTSATREFLHTRNQGQFTSDVRTSLYRQTYGPPELRLPSWPAEILEDIRVQIRLARSPHECTLWRIVEQGILDTATSPTPSGAVERVDLNLRKLRHHYDSTEHALIAKVGQRSGTAEVSVGIACLATVLCLVVYVLLVRDWLVRPVDLLTRAADSIGQGHLDHAIPLTGSDELAYLARRLETMGRNLEAQQRALIEARELSTVGELCTSVAHGLRNPLSALRMSAQLGARSNDEPRFEEIIHQVDRMEQRIARMMAYSRSGTPKWRDTTFGLLADLAVAEARPLLLSHGVEVVIDDRTTTGAWLIDREPLVSAIAELITNAALHSPDNGTVVVRGLSPTHEELAIEVEDHGSGMSAATASKAFNLFFTSRPEGSGVGLAMVQRTVERHEGSVSLQSQLGSGTTASVRIPKRHHGQANSSTPVTPTTSMTS
jgi:signal transduction histidine kinase